MESGSMTAPTIAEIDTILDLKDGWDGYRGRPISPATIAKAIDYAKALNLAPHKWHAVPCGDGSIQLEQHTNGFDIEILVRFAGCADPDMIEVLPFTGEGGAA
jgi:hypothetical protein